MNALILLAALAAGDWQPAYIQWPLTVPDEMKGRPMELFYDGQGWTHYPHRAAKRHVWIWTGSKWTKPVAQLIPTDSHSMGRGRQRARICIGFR